MCYQEFYYHDVNRFRLALIICLLSGPSATKYTFEPFVNGKEIDLLLKKSRKSRILKIAANYVVCQNFQENCCKFFVLGKLILSAPVGAHSAPLRKS